MSSSDNLLLPYIMPSQAQKHVTHNEAIRMLDAIVQLSVLELNRETVPTIINGGDRYILGGNPTGDFENQAGKIACFQDGAWAFLTPQIGWIAYVIAENKYYYFENPNWTALASAPSALDILGVNTIADASNKLAVKSDNILFSHDDVTPGNGDIQIALNKSQLSGSGSLVFKSNWIGHAEIGLTGSNAFTLKVSADGNLWHNALTILPETGAISHSAGKRHSFIHDSNKAGLSILPFAGDPIEPEDGDIWYNSSTQSFRKHQNGVISDLASGSGSGTANPTGASGSLQFNNSGNFGGSSSLHYDSTNGRLGIGTQTPIHQLDISENFNLPATTLTQGTCYQAGVRFLHSFGTNNIFLGNTAGNFTLSGSGNVGIGRLSLSNLVSGSSNLGFGDLALRFVSTGQQNIGVGASALTSLTTGRFNVAIGTNAAKGVTSTNGNIAVGYNALFNSTTGNNCTAIGYKAGFNLTTGVNNTLVGSEAGGGITTGSHNTIIGPAKALPATLSNTVVLADGQGNTRIEANASGAIFDGYIKPKSYTVVTIPPASAAGEGAMIYVSDEVNGGIPAFSDGVNWLRMSDRVVVS